MDTQKISHITVPFGESVSHDDTPQDVQDCVDCQVDREEALLDIACRSQREIRAQADRERWAPHVLQMALDRLWRAHDDEEVSR